MQKIAIGRINNPRAAQAFCDYLKGFGIKAWIESQDDNCHIYITDEAQEDLACAELRDFLSNPNDSKYLDASWNRGAGKTFIKPISTGTDSINTFIARTGTLTKTLVAISVLVTLITAFGDYEELTRWLYISDRFKWQGELAEIKSGQIWRLITPIFLHFMVIHILFNMMWLWDLGGKVEKNQSAYFLGFFVISIGIMSNMIQYLSTGPAFGGMSGVVYGLLGYTWIRSLKPNSGYHLNSSIIALMLVWLILGYTGILGAIGNAAHLSGLLLGVAYGFGINNYE